jgi:hypothetical protein
MVRSVTIFVRRSIFPAIALDLARPLAHVAVQHD